MRMERNTDCTGDATPDIIETFNFADRMRFQSLLHGMVEELKMRRELDIENEKKIKKLLNDKFSLGWKWDQSLNEISSLNQQHSVDLRESKRKNDDKIREHKIEASQNQMYKRLIEKERDALRQEMTKLQLTNYSLEKQSREAERLEKMLTDEREEHLKQVSEFENQRKNLMADMKKLTEKQDKMNRDCLPLQRNGARCRSQPNPIPGPSMENLPLRAQRLIEEGLTPNTRLAYNSAVNAFSKFRKQYSLNLTWPASSNHIIWFIAYCFEQGLAPRTIQGYVAGVNYFHKINGWLDISKCFVVTKMLQGCSRLKKSADLRAPITKSVLQALLFQLPFVCYNTYEVKLFTAVWVLAYFGLFRVSELVLLSARVPNSHLQLSDISIVNKNSTLLVRLRKYKTNQMASPVTLRIPCENAEFCPVKCILDFLSMRPRIETSLFCHNDGKPLTRTQFAAVLQKCISRTAYNTRAYKTHSFRIGRATDLAKAGLPGETIIELGRWRSDAYKSYIR